MGHFATLRDWRRNAAVDGAGVTMTNPRKHNKTQKGRKPPTITLQEMPESVSRRGFWSGPTRYSNKSVRFSSPCPVSVSCFQVRCQTDTETGHGLENLADLLLYLAPIGQIGQEKNGTESGISGYVTARSEDRQNSLGNYRLDDGEATTATKSLSPSKSTA